MFKRGKGAALLMALAVGSLALAACGGDAEDSSSAKELKLWHYEGPDSAMGVAWNQAIKEFEASHPA